MHSIIICVVFSSAYMRCTRLCSLNPSVTKRKRKSSPPRLAVFGPTPLSLPRARSPLGPRSQSPARPPAPAYARAAPPLPLIGRPHPSVAPTLAPLRPPSLWQAGPACQPLLPLARDEAIGAFAAGHRPPHRLSINTLTSSVWRLTPPRIVPEPSLHPRMPESYRRHCVLITVVASSPVLATSPPFPSPAAYKRTTPSPLLHHTRP
jgi:hypothetical protein